MQYYRCEVNHAGNRDMRIHKDEVTPAEIILLRAIHGADSVTGVAKTRDGKAQQPAERERLASRYGAKLFATLFPGALPRMPLTLSDAGLAEDGREMQARESGEDDEDAPAAPSETARAIAARVAAKQAAAKGDGAALT